MGTYVNDRARLHAVCALLGLEYANVCYGLAQHDAGSPDFVIYGTKSLNDAKRAWIHYNVTFHVHAEPRPNGEFVATQMTCSDPMTSVLCINRANDLAKFHSDHFFKYRRPPKLATKKNRGAPSHRAWVRSQQQKPDGDHPF